MTGRAFELIESLVKPATLSMVDVRSASFVAGGRRAEVVLSPDGSGSAALGIVARRDFDAALLAAAIGVGAEHVARRATAFEPTADGWSIRAGSTRLTSQWLIGADGATSMVRKCVSSAFPRSELSIATGYFVKGARLSEIAVDFDDVPTGYVWAFPRTDHLAVGACGQADAISSSALLGRTSRWIARHIPTASMERYSWPIPSLSERALRAEQPAGRNWMLVGDAAGLVDPITREGIYFALLSADLAAVCLQSASPAATYASALRASVYDELQRAARLKARFFHPQLLSLLVKGLNRSLRVRAIMADLVAGRQSYAGLRRRLLATFELRLMLELFSQRSKRSRLTNAEPRASRALERPSPAEPPEPRVRYREMPHPLVIATFKTPVAAASAARELHAIGVPRDRISVVARSHDEEGALAEQMDATPGADIEDSRPAARLGELSGQVLAAIALVMPGIGPIVAAGPLSAGLGEAAGHVAGGIASVLSGAGLSEERALRLQRAVESGAVLLGVHAEEGEASAVRKVLEGAGAGDIEVARWEE